MTFNDAVKYLESYLDLTNGEYIGEVQFEAKELTTYVAKELVKGEK